MPCVSYFMTGSTLLHRQRPSLVMGEALWPLSLWVQLSTHRYEPFSVSSFSSLPSWTYPSSSHPKHLPWGLALSSFHKGKSSAEQGRFTLGTFVSDDGMGSLNKDQCDFHIESYIHNTSHLCLMFYLLCPNISWRVELYLRALNYSLNFPSSNSILSLTLACGCNIFSEYY